MSNKIRRGGMIGAGAWSETQLTAWAGVKNAKIVALCDRHPDRLIPIADRFEIPHRFQDFGAMLDQANLDFVDICTRPYAHSTLVAQAVEHKLPILCQKPFCTSVDEAAALVRLCRQRGVRLMVNENFRWQRWYRQAKSVIEAGRLGQPFLAKLHRRSRLTLPHFDHPQSYLADMPRLALYELGVHYLDTFRFLFGDPQTVFARLHHISPHMKGEDVQMITLSYPQMTGVIIQSWASVPVPDLDRPTQPHDYVPAPRLEIDGPEGTLILKADNSMHLFTDSTREQWQFSPTTRPDSCVTTQQHFIDCLENGAEFETSGAETLKTMALVYACYRSAQEARAVAPAELWNPPPAN
jgi:predicted dehydrogenase